MNMITMKPYTVPTKASALKEVFSKGCQNVKDEIFHDIYIKHLQKGTEHYT